MNKTLNQYSKPLVTIGVPVYNGEKFILETLSTALNQTYRNIEIVISDNASTDNTQQICESIASKHKNVSYIRHLKNNGPTRNFNFLLEQASGKYFMWLGDDDWLDKNYVECCVSTLEDRDDYGIVAGEPVYHKRTESYTGIAMNLLDESPSLRVIKYFSNVQHNGIFYGLFRTEHIQDNKLKNLIGGDLLVVASTLFKYKAATNTDTRVHRRRGGSSNSGQLAEIMGLGTFARKYPRLSLAYNLVNHVFTDRAFNESYFLTKLIISTASISAAFFRKLLTIIVPHKFKETAG